MKASKIAAPASVNALTPRASSRFTPRPFHASQVDQREEKKENRTGLPDSLKAGIEYLSGLSLEDVKVHYGSSRPAELHALAYTQGNTIHIGPGQEKHLPHEAWHVVQQAQGRVRSKIQMKAGVVVNNDEGLEHEADAIGAKVVHSSFLDAIPRVRIPRKEQSSFPWTAVRCGAIDPEVE